MSHAVPRVACRRCKVCRQYAYSWRVAALQSLSHAIRKAPLLLTVTHIAPRSLLDHAPLSNPSGEENVSVIVAPILPGFELASLGDPQSAARQFLATLAPEGSGLIATLISASARTMPAPQQQPGQQQQQLYYTLEYTVQGPKFFRHNVSVYTARWAS